MWGFLSSQNNSRISYTRIEDHIWWIEVTSGNIQTEAWWKNDSGFMNWGGKKFKSDVQFTTTIIG